MSCFKEKKETGREGGRAGEEEEKKGKREREQVLCTAT